MCIRRKGEFRVATTAIWGVTDRLKRVLDYAANPDKTAERSEGGGLEQVLVYTQADAKTEKQLYVSGVNCDPSTAYEQMQRTKRQFLRRTAYWPFTPIKRLRRVRQRRKSPIPSVLNWHRSCGGAL